MKKVVRPFLPLLFCFQILFFAACSSFSGRDFEVTLVSYGDSEFKVDVAKYASTTPSQKSLLILPPTGGENFVDRSYARQFTRAGYDVYIVREWTGMLEKSTDLEIHQRLYI